MRGDAVRSSPRFVPSGVLLGRPSAAVEVASAPCSCSTGRRAPSSPTRSFAARSVRTRQARGRAQGPSGREPGSPPASAAAIKNRGLHPKPSDCQLPLAMTLSQGMSGHSTEDGLTARNMHALLGADRGERNASARNLKPERANSPPPDPGLAGSAAAIVRHILQQETPRQQGATPT